jgi:hypothetical protein
MPTVHLQLVPVFFNPLFQLDCEGLFKELVEEKQPKRATEHDRHSISTRASKTVQKCFEKWRDDSLDQYLHRKQKRAVSAYMDNHKILSLLRTFEIMSHHKEGSGLPVTISSHSGAGGGYVGIVSSRGDVEVNPQFPIGMMKIVIDPVQNVVMLRSSTMDCYLTGHTDRAAVDGRTDSSDVTACHWKVVQCKNIFQDAPFDHNHVVLQYYGKKHCKDSLQDSMSFIQT